MQVCQADWHFASSKPTTNGPAAICIFYVLSDRCHSWTYGIGICQVHINIGGTIYGLKKEVTRPPRLEFTHCVRFSVVSQQEHKSHIHFQHNPCTIGFVQATAVAVLPRVILQVCPQHNEETIVAFIMVILRP
jgi:hypothetical protein